ncbi:hypothetical protein BZA05DRAFT_330219 [Tricharina praecox]|uniref:uncharacterized protein n=1 Tax=Tricharina praecox TaxID=43433 RepID=UPI00222075FC|nr:uncharacterized protein BZA05DRAFT_330219 [Tricharina praecox]KAI5858352.1 hypothetical protein BZA05DRAFT_330219 [Tricharina praecox]
MVSECVVCTEEYDKTDMIILSCEHAYCVSVDCLKAPFNIALKDKKPFTCCSQRVDIGLAGTHITPEFVASYRLMLLELDTPNPLYCPAPNCSSFIPPAGIRGDTGSCPKCATAVCRHCRKASHSGICTEDKEGQMVRNLVKQQRWMECPKCKTVVERKEGCLHMTCRCSAEFCYSCGVLYGDKPGQCLGNCNRK